MSVKKDNHIDPNIKARWDFTGGPGEVRVGHQTVGETGGVDSVRTDADRKAAHNNGGGDSLNEKVVLLGEQNASLQSQLSAVGVLAAGLRAGKLELPDGEGPAVEVHDALTGLLERLKADADRIAELEELVDKLQSPAGTEDKVAELKAKLDKAGVSYRANASLESLEIQVAALPAE